MAIQSTALTSTPAAVYTSIDTNAVVVAYFCNTGNDPVQFTVYAVPNGATADITNAIYFNVNLTANDTYVVDTEKIILDDGDSLWASATVDGVVIATINNIGV
jgi:hypothetical protein